MQKIESKIIEADVLVGEVSFEPLHGKWIDIEVEIKVGNGLVDDTSGCVAQLLHAAAQPQGL